MVWHIFKKDWKLLWLFVMAVASLHWIGALILIKLGLFGEDPTLEMLSILGAGPCFFRQHVSDCGDCDLEAIPGTRQDWLTRPVPRGVLLLEKFLFALIAVEGPIFLGGLAEGPAGGFSWRSSFLAAAWRVVFLLFFILLPIFAFASVTKNMTEAFILGCGCYVHHWRISDTDGSINGWAHETLIVVTHSGVGWIAEVFRFVLVTVAACVIAGVAVFSQKDCHGAFLVIGFGLLLLLSTFLPWRPAFAIEEKLSAKPGAGAETKVTFDQVRESSSRRRAWLLPRRIPCAVAAKTTLECFFLCRLPECATMRFCWGIRPKYI